MVVVAVTSPMLQYQWGSSFPKDGHSATKTELEIIQTNIRGNKTQTLTPPKTGNREPQQSYHLEIVSKALYWRGGGA